MTSPPPHSFRLYRIPIIFQSLCLPQETHLKFLGYFLKVLPFLDGKPCAFTLSVCARELCNPRTSLSILAM